MYKIIKPLVFLLDSERAHDLSIGFLKNFPRLAGICSPKGSYDNLHQDICGLRFKNPVGMAAGFDKNAEAVRALAGFGFGFVEVGTVTPKPQGGNEKPRIFRLTEDEAVINRLGFNNKGADYFASNIASMRTAQAFVEGGDVVLGVNIGKNKSSESAVEDYLILLERFYDKASYITLNISSPNTKNLRDLQKDSHLDEFLAQIMAKKKELVQKTGEVTPIWLKVAPDLDEKQQNDIAEAVLRHKVDALIVSNTTIERGFGLKSNFSDEQGGLSGKPLFEKSNQVLRNFYRLTDAKVPLVGVGGVSCAKDAYEKIRMGASLVQIYSAFVYQGFDLVDEVNRGLSELVTRDGFGGVAEAIGSGV